MMAVNVAKEMTQKAIQYEIETKKQKAEAICNGLDDKITKACIEGKNEIIVEAPKDLFSYVVNTCKDAGYTTTLLTHTTFKLIW